MPEPNRYIFGKPKLKKFSAESSRTAKIIAMNFSERSQSSVDRQTHGNLWHQISDTTLQ